MGLGFFFTAVYTFGAGPARTPPVTAGRMPAATLLSVQIVTRREISRTNIEHSTPLSREQAFNIHHCIGALTCNGGFVSVSPSVP
jgi:hypothetical protein